MKTIGIFISFMLLSMSCFADRVILNSAPTMLEVRDGVYYIPKGYVNSYDGFYYVSVDNEARVCYTTAQSVFDTAVKTIQVNMDGTLSTWNCYVPNKALESLSTP